VTLLLPQIHTLFHLSSLPFPLHSIGDAVITTDTFGNIISMNKIAEAITEWTLQEVAGKQITNAFKIIHQTAGQKNENPIEAVLKNGQLYETEGNTVIVTKSGKEIMIDNNAAPIKDSQNNTIGVVLVFRDITEKTRFQETVQKTAKLDSLAILAGGIAHDFNNLLSGIYGTLELTKMNATDQERSEYMTTAISTINRARSLTQQLLTFSKGGEPVKETKPLFPFIQNAVQFALSGSNILCHYDIPEDLWLSDYDENQIGQVIENITINAVQSMPGGGIIKLNAENYHLINPHPLLKKQNYIKISITDTGIGISKEFLPRIFDPFFTTKAKGYGLGLATSYSIIKKHQGLIEVESEPGKGATFHIYLPSSGNKAHSNNVTDFILHSGQGLFIIMDDEEVIRFSLKNMLKFMGYQVICTSSGEEVIDVFEKAISTKQIISGMIFDLTIPGAMGGKEAINFIRAKNTHIPVFVASGYSDDPILSDPQQYGFSDSLRKPFNYRELSDLLDRHMTKPQE